MTKEKIKKRTVAVFLFSLMFLLSANGRVELQGNIFTYKFNYFIKAYFQNKSLNYRSAALLVLTIC
jgi:hypothetical protein